MLTKAKALYQVKLILESLSEEEYKLIPKEEIEYIENNFEYDKNIKIDPKVPLEKQNIDNQAFEILDRIVNAVDRSKEKISKQDDEIEKIKEENIRLRKIIDLLENENSKILKARDIIENYQEKLNRKEQEIKKLKANNQNLYESIQKFPKFLRKIFIKDIETKYLLGTKNK